MNRRSCVLALTALFLTPSCGKGGRSTTADHELRVEMGTVRMTDLPPYEAGKGSGEEEEEAPVHAPTIDFAVPLHARARARAGADQPGAARSALTSGTAAASFNAATSPAPSAGFLAMGMSSNWPPDTNGAVGPHHVMSTTNDQVVVHDRQGNVLTSVGLTSFWGASWSDIQPAWDPNVRYDPYAGRFIFVCMANYGKAGSSLLVAVSATSDPTGLWYQRRIYADPSTTIDHPRVGFNGKWIAVTGNTLSGTNLTFAYVNMFAFDKADLYANGTKWPVKFGNLANMHTLTPALTYDPTVDTLYLVSNYNGNDTSASPAMGYLALSTLTGPVGSEVLSVNVAFPGTTNTWASKLPSPPNLAPQAGSCPKIGVFDARMNTLVYRNGSLWATHTVFVPAASPTLSAVDWWQLGTDGTVQQFGRITDPTGVYFYSYPSLAVNAQGDMLIGYSRMAATEYATAAYALRTASDPPGTVRQEFLAQPGVGPYCLLDGSGANRWGDYSVSQVDPVNDTDLWTMQEFAAGTTSSQWGTWWVSVPPPEVSAVLQAIAVSPSTVTGGQGATGTVTVGSAAPAGGLVIGLSSGNAVAQVPPSVTVPAGATSATFPVTTTATTASLQVSISAIGGGVTQSALLSVEGPTGYALAVSGQPNRSGAVPLNGARLSGNAYVFTSYASNIQDAMPAGITSVCYWLDNPAMSGTATHCEGTWPWDFAGTYGTPYTSVGNPWNTATLANGSHTITQQVTEPGGATETDTASFTIDNSSVLQALGVSPADLTSGQSATGTVTMSAPAPSTGTTIRLSSNNSAAQPPAAITVPAGATSATFTVSTGTVGAATTVTLSAALGLVTQTAAVTVHPATSFSVSANPVSVNAGQVSVGTISLGGPAPSGGATVTLSSNSTAALVPSAVTLAAGATSATFDITTSAVVASTPVTISASYGGATQSTTVTVNPPAALQSLGVLPAAVLGGESSVGTVTLNGGAPATGATVSLSSGNAAAAVPATVTIPANGTSATFGITTGAVTVSTPVTISASYGGTTQTATLTVAPTAALQSLTVNPSTVVGGQGSVGAVTLTGPAPTGGAVVALASGGPAAQVPASVTVAAGATSATFAVTTSAVATSTPVTLSATYGAVTQSTALIVTATPALRVVQAQQSFNASTGTTITANITTTPGSLLVAFVREGSSATDAFTVTDSLGQAWTLAGYNSFSSVERCGTFYMPSSGAVTSVTASFTTSGGVIRPGIVVYEIAGAAAAAPVDVGTIGSTTQADIALTSAALTTSNATDILIFAVDVSANQTGFTPGAGFVFPATGSAITARQAVAYQVVSSPQASLVTSMAWPSGASAASQFIAFKAAPPATLQSVAVSPSTVISGQGSTGTVTLNGPAPAGGATVTLSSGNVAAQVPASVTVAAGATGATFAVTTSAVTTSTAVTLSATYGTVTQVATLTVTPPLAVQSVVMGPSTVTGGQGSTGTVTLTGPAPSGGATVSLSSGDASVQVPASVTVPAGGTSATFAVTTGPVGVATAAIISATYGAVTQTAVLTVNPPALQSVAVSPSTVISGQGTTGTVTLSGPAPAGGAFVTLSSGNAAAQVPASVTVAAGATSATFAVTTSAVTTSTAVTLSATYGTVTQVATLTVTPSLALQSVAVSPSTVTGGQSSTGTVALTGPAPSGGATVSLSSGDVSVQVPASVTVPAGSTGATFAVTTGPVGVATAAIISATYGAVTQTAVLTVNPPALLSIAVSPSTVVSGQGSMGAVTLNGPAPAGGATVSVSSGDVSVQVPPLVTVLAGATSATFAVTTSAVTTSTAVAVSATYGTVTQIAFLTVTPAVALQSVAVSPPTVTGGQSSTGTVALSGPAPTGGATVSLSSGNAAAQVSASVIVPAGSTGAVFAVTTSAVGASTAAIISATYGAVTQTATLTVEPAVLQSIAVSPSTVTGGQGSTGTVTLNGPAPTSGATVSLSSGAAAAQVPPSVTVAPGATSATFGITTSVVTTSIAVTLSATYGTATLSNTLTVNAKAPPSVVQARQILTGNNKQATVTVSIATTPGNLLVAFVREGSNATDAFTVTDNLGQAWTPVGYGSFGSVERCGLFYVANSGAVTSVTARFTTSSGVVRPGIVVYEIAGASATSPLDAGPATTTVTQNVTNITSGPLTTTNASDLLLFAVDVASNESAFTPGAGFAFPAAGGAVNARQAVAYRAGSASQTSLTTSMRWPSSAAASSLFAAFR